MAKKGAVNNYPEAPDGGWGWFVVLGSFLTHVFIVGTFKSFGVFFPYLQEAFGQDAAATAWVSSIMGSVMLFGSLPAGALCNVFGCRAVVMTGSLLATTGLLSSMFVTSLAVMNLTAGFITGLGMSFMYTPCITTVGRAVFLSSVVGIADCVARIGYGWFSNLNLYPLLRGFVVCSLCLGLSLMFLPFAQTYASMVVCCLFIGASMGCLSTMTAVFLAEFCGVKRLASAVGIAFGVRGFSMLFGPPLAGYLYDVTGNYNVSFYFAGGAVLCSTFMASALEAHRTRSVQRQNFDMLRLENASRKSPSKSMVEDKDADDSNGCLISRETSV